MTEDADDTVAVVAVEVAPDRDDREDEEGGDERQIRRQLEGEAIRVVGDQIFLSGTIDLDTWTDKTSGKERTKIKLKAFRSRRIQKGKASQDGDAQAPGQQPAQKNYHQPQLFRSG